MHIPRATLGGEDRGANGSCPDEGIGADAPTSIALSRDSELGAELCAGCVPGHLPSCTSAERSSTAAHGPPSPSLCFSSPTQYSV